MFSRKFSTKFAVRPRAAASDFRSQALAAAANPYVGASGAAFLLLATVATLIGVLGDPKAGSPMVRLTLAGAPGAKSAAWSADSPDGVAMDPHAPPLEGQAVITLGGDAPSGDVTIRVFGQEGGLPVPMLERDLARPIRISKSRPGLERITTKLPEPIHVDGTQFFLVVESVSPGVLLLSDNQKKRPACVNGLEEFHHQFLKLRDGSWRSGIYAFTPAQRQAARIAPVVAQPLFSLGWSLGPDQERRAHCDLLRDLFGNPFRPVAVAREWRTPEVQGLALAAYEERTSDGSLNRGLLAILADALEEAANPGLALLDHLRQPGLHVRGCWVVDGLLGRG